MDADRAAALAYHGKTRPPKMAVHRVELKWEITPSCELPDDEGSWKLENVSGKLIAKGDDILAYRLVYSFPQGKALGHASLLIKVWPELPEHGRRDGRPEVGFLVTPPSQSQIVRPGNYYTELTHSVVVATGSTDGVDRVTAIYFSIEDCNFEPTGPPLWRLRVNDSVLLSRIPALKGRWIPLPCLHPDPAVDPGVPIQLRPQHDPKWYWYRNESANYDIFKGTVSLTVMLVHSVDSSLPHQGRYRPAGSLTLSLGATLTTMDSGTAATTSRALAGTLSPKASWPICWPLPTTWAVNVGPTPIHASRTAVAHPTPSSSMQAERLTHSRPGFRSAG